jgi:hypothetical protein
LPINEEKRDLTVATVSKKKKVQFQFACYKYVDGSKFDFSPRTVVIKSGNIKFYRLKDTSKLPFHCLTELDSSRIIQVKTFSIKSDHETYKNLSCYKEMFSGIEKPTDLYKHMVEMRLSDDLSEKFKSPIKIVRKGTTRRHSLSMQEYNRL